MAWRDRTNLYISYRQSYSHHPTKRNPYTISSSHGYDDSPPGTSLPSNERQGLMSNGAFDDDGSVVIEMDRLPPRWADISEEVTELLATIALKSQQLERLHQKHVLPGFDDEHVKKREEIDIERLTQDITRGFHACQKAIKRIELIVKQNRQSSSGSSKGEETMAKNIQINLAGRVQEASAEFRKKQSTYLKKLKALSGYETPIERSSTPQNPYSDPSLMDSEIDKTYSERTLATSSQLQSKRRSNTNDQAIATREREINDIAQGIIELADIFRELQAMIIDQGTMLDRIDYNVERMAVDVKAADKELTVATGYQKKSLKRKIILLLILLIVGMFIVLMVKPKRHSRESPQPIIDPVVDEGDTGL